MSQVKHVGALAVVGAGAAVTACAGYEALTERSGARSGSPLAFITPGVDHFAD
jgi:hypothetical protein